MFISKTCRHSKEIRAGNQFLSDKLFISLESANARGQLAAMKFFYAWAGILFFVFCGLTSRAAIVNGQSYVSLADWARVNGFRETLLDKEIILTNKISRLVFNTDSDDSEINGVDVRLSFPIAKGALISQLDLEKTVRPLAFPQKLPDKKIRTICLDPGHGGKDSGNRAGWHYEKNYTLPLALELRDQLKKLGFNVILTRSKDVYVDLPERPAIANRDGADLFVSLHFNASPNDPENVEGPETYCITPAGANSSNAGNVEFSSSIGTGPTTANRDENESLLLAYEVERSLVENLNANDRGVKRARFAVLRDAKMPAILIEGGFMTHPVEGKKIYGAAYRRQMASAIVKGILAYQKLTAPPVPPPKMNPAGTNKVSNVKKAK
jgi:N-acetylmuramoyl-L-alanine amidase